MVVLHTKMFKKILFGLKRSISNLIVLETLVVAATEKSSVATTIATTTSSAEL